MKALVAAASLALAIPAVCSAAMVLQTANTPRTITFDAAVNDTAIGGTVVYGYAAGQTYGYVSEGTSVTGTTGWRSASVTVRGTGLNLGYGAGNWTVFGTNANGDADTSDNITVSGMTIGRGSTGMVNATVCAPLGGTNAGTLFGQANGAPYRDNGFTLAVRNGTGNSMPSIRVQFDAWNGDNDTSYSNLRLSYSTDDVNYTVVTTLNGARTTTAAPFDSANAAHWGPLQTLDQTITVPGGLAADGLAYIRIESLRAGGAGSGSNWLMDNFAVTAVPEPAAIMTLGLAGITLLARKRNKGEAAGVIGAA